VRAVIVANPVAHHQQGWGGAFRDGLARHGINAVMREDPAPADLLVLWGTRRQEAIAQQRRSGGQVCILERGYIGDRHRWSSVSFGGQLNGRAEFRGVTTDPTRFEQNFAGMMKPWRRQEGYALLIGQVPGDMSIEGANISRWYRQMADDLQAAGFKVRYRSHPVADDRGFRPEEIAGAPKINGSLADALTGASLVVTFNSNTAVESVLAGVPTIAADRGSMAYDVTGRTVGDLVTPDRTEWAARLAWKQWTLEEIASGEFWARACG
jgi:hypothetical protein